MKRFSRALALVLLLSIVLTAFGIFSGFAAEAAEPTYGKVVYDMDKKTSITVTHGGHGPVIKKNADNIWNISYEGIDPTLIGKNTLDDKGTSQGEYWDADPSEKIYINGEKKNTDYFVIDFDISTETSLVDGIYFHNRWMAADGETKAQGNYIQLNGTSLDDFYVSRYQGSGYSAPATKPGDWLNVTFLYDFHSDNPSEWKLYIYFDGIYCGTQTGLLTTAVSWSFMRVSTDPLVQNGPDASTLFANFTYTKFEHGYDGPLTKSSLGHQAVTLDQLADLAYTQKNTPVKSGEKQPMASIERVGEADPILVYDYSDINVNLKDGDVVTLYRSLSTPIVKDSAATVTFKDANGKEVIPGTIEADSLVYVAPVKEVDYSAGNVLVRANSNFRGSKSWAKDKTYSYTVTNGLTLETKKTNTYWLLDDIEYTTVEAKPDVGRYYIDLNGHTLTMARTSKKFLLFDKSNGMVAMRNGTLNASGSNNYAQTNGSALVIFDDINMTLKGASISDQRAGVIIINRTNINASCAINTLRSSGATRGTLIINDSYVETSANTVIYNTTINSSSMRQGSMDCRLFVNNSTLKSTAEGGCIVGTEIHANATGTEVKDDAGNVIGFTPSNAYYAENDNDVTINIVNSELSCSGPAFIANVMELRTGKHDLTEQFTLDYNIDIVESDVTAGYLYKAHNDASMSVLADPAKYNFDSYIKLDEASNITLTNETSAMVLKSTVMPSATVNIDVPEEYRWYTADVIEYASADVASKFDKDGPILGAYWVTYEQEGMLPVVYTKNVKSYPYIFNGHEYEFMQHAEMEPSFKDIPVSLPADSSMLTYKWVYNVDGAFEAVASYIGPIKANVTASETLALNIYLPASFGDEAYKYIYTEKQRVENIFDITANGVDYKGFTIHGIDPASAAVDTTVKFRVVDENGSVANVSVEVSVLDYIEAALKDTAIAASDKALVASILNYIAATAKYNNPTAELDADIAALLELDEYKSVALEAPVLGEAKATVANAAVFSAVRVALNNKLTYEFLVKDGYEGDITISYTTGGALVEETLTVVGGEIISVGFLAYEVDDSVITVTSAEGSGEINLAGYLGMISEAEKTDELTSLIDAITIYTAAAKAVRA